MRIASFGELSSLKTARTPFLASNSGTIDDGILTIIRTKMWRISNKFSGYKGNPYIARISFCIVFLIILFHMGSWSAFSEPPKFALEE